MDEHCCVSCFCHFRLASTVLHCLWSFTVPGHTPTNKYNGVRSVSAYDDSKRIPPDQILLLPTRGSVCSSKVFPVHYSGSRPCKQAEEGCIFAQGSALAALKGEQTPIGAESVRQLMQAVDGSVPAPQRPVNLPFAMPIEDVFNIQASALALYFASLLSSGHAKISL